MKFQAEEHPHRRLNLLTGTWVLVSPHRAKRPWQGQKERAVTEPLADYDPQCYLCPGNARAGGQINPPYTQTFVFDNDFSALLPDNPRPAEDSSLFRVSGVQGLCRVVCFSPFHNRTLPLLCPQERQAVVDTWCEQSTELGRRFCCVQVFENKGQAMGCSNAHPHGQIWATDFWPNEIMTENLHLLSYLQAQGRDLLGDVLQAELKAEERVVVSSKHWLAVVPFWASWPYETLLISRSHRKRLGELEPSERHDLAEVLRKLTTRYDNLFQCSFPYSMGWHGAPFDLKEADHWRLHAHFYPPLLRSATVKKFMVGFEMLGEVQRDLTAEQAASRLREQSEVHYGRDL